MKILDKIRDFGDMPVSFVILFDDVEQLNGLFFFSHILHSSL